MSISIRYYGVDEWSRVVFRGDNGHFYKSVDCLSPDGGGFLAAENEEQERILGDLHTCSPHNDPEGEPCSPVGRGNFTLVSPE